MASITIRSVPSELHQRLKKHAEMHRRSLNQEILYQLERALAYRPVNPDEVLSDLARFHASFDRPLPDRAQEAKRLGRA